MFRPTSNGYNVPHPGTIEYLEVRPASRGGGWIVNLIVSGKQDTMVFTDANALTQNLMVMLNGATLMNMRQQAAGNPPPKDVLAAARAKPAPVADPELPVAQPKRKGGRPKLTEAQKAERKAAREKEKAIADIPVQEVKEAA